MKILLTGGTGFIGRNLLRFLRLQKARVTALVRPSTDQTVLLENGAEVWVDTGSTTEMLDYFQSQKYDGIIHLASFFIRDHRPEQVDELLRTNLLLAGRLLEAAAGAQVKWFINTGTSWQHHQNAAYAPVNLYAAAKQAVETLAQYYLAATRLNVVTLVLSDTYGPGDTRPKLMNLWHRSREVMDMSAGEQVLDLTYIEDVVDAFWRLAGLLEKDNSGQWRGRRFAVRSGESITVRQLADLFASVTGHPLQLHWGAVPYHAREVMTPWEEGELVPGWRPRFSLREGIDKTYGR
ncbi:NAD(P)-dependent oxidoreductase [candidate division FCPU426 bacterium]|nr:NAD(P)-dependent oxidoreductase [candidate division FCPU426 bacterium]